MIFIKQSRTLFSVAFALCFFSGCNGTLGTTLDPSIKAIEANDLTLAISGCEALPGRGGDICRVKEGQPIESFLRLVVPVDNRVFLSGELTLYFKDVSKTFAITKPLIEIPWKDIFQDEVWTQNHNMVVKALAQIRYKLPNGVEEIWDAQGFIRLVVLKSGYDPLPIDSGFAAFKKNCKIQYSTSGRSAIKCQ